MLAEILGGAADFTKDGNARILGRLGLDQRRSRGLGSEENNPRACLWFSVPELGNGARADRNDVIGQRVECVLTDRAGRSGAVIILGSTGSRTEQLDGGVSPNLIFAGEAGLNGRINFDDWDDSLI